MLREILVATIMQSDVRAYRGAMRSLGMFDSRRWLADLRMPVLVITGTQDSTVSPQVQQVLLDGIPGARQVLIQGAGHAASIDRPEEFNRALLDFLTS